MRKTGLKGVAKYFFVDFNPIYTNDVLNICRYLIKKT